MRVSTAVPLLVVVVVKVSVAVGEAAEVGFMVYLFFTPSCAERVVVWSSRRETFASHSHPIGMFISPWPIRGLQGQGLWVGTPQ